MLNNISTYLNGEDYRISILKNGIHVLNYKILVDIKENEAILKMENKTIRIQGKNLRLIELDKKELLIHGTVLKVDINEH